MSNPQGWGEDIDSVCNNRHIGRGLERVSLLSTNLDRYYIRIMAEVPRQSVNRLVTLKNSSGLD